MLLPPIRARKKVSGKCRPATMPELRNFAFDSRVVTLVANTMTSPGFLFKNIRASSCRIYIWNLAFSSFSWQLVSSLRDRPCMGLARLASHVLRETFFFRETCLLVSEEFMFFKPKTRIPRRDVYKLLCGLESWRTPLKRCWRFAPRSKKRNRQAELCVRIPPTKVYLARFFPLFVVIFVACASVLSSRVHFPCTQVSFSQVRNKNRSEELVRLIVNPA